MSEPRAAPSPLLIEPTLKHYAWGDADYLPQLLDRAPTGEPVAEAWYGAHPLGPATVAGEGPLDAFLSHHPEVLGDGVARAYGRLPYLLKILAVRSPLSIQVHPSPSQAREGFAREEREGVPLDSPRRRYKDPFAKPELLVALTPFEALCGFRPLDAIAETLARTPELTSRLPAFEPEPAGLRALLEAWFALPEAEGEAALAEVCARLERGAPPAPDSPEALLLRVHRAVSPDGVPDRGLLFTLLLSAVRLAPGEGLFLPAGVPHCYLRGSGVELMASSDNVLRAGLTPKFVDPAELLRVVRFDGPRPAVLTARPGSRDGLTRYATAADEMALARAQVGPDRPWSGRAEGPTTLLALEAEITVEVDGASVRVPRGRACLLPDGAAFRVVGTTVQSIFVAAVAKTSLTGEAAFAAAIQRNIAHTEALFARGRPPGVIGTVSGSASSRDLWQGHLDRARAEFGARRGLAFHEDLPVNQAFGLLLLWQRLRAELQPGEGALIAFVFGKGTRAAPITEAACGQKPAIASFVPVGEGAERRLLSTVELALRYFAPVEAFLRRSGFDGVVIKWGDEVQIPTRDLSGVDPRFADADVVRFVSMRAITADTAANKDWVGVDRDGRVTAFIPRRPLEQMMPLVERGLIQRQGDHLIGGVNLGSIALSRALLERLHEEFEGEVNDPNARRGDRPDLDPQLFTALTVAAVAEPEARQRAWAAARAESPAIEALEQNLPGVIDRLRRVLDRLEADLGRPVRMVALDFGDQYWGDIGQHRQMGAFFGALREEGASGRIARSLAGLAEDSDPDGNRIAGSTRLGPGVRVRGSVLIDVQVDAGDIEDSVLIGTRAGHLVAKQAFDVRSVAPGLELAPRSGAYEILAAEDVAVGEGERAATVMLPDRSLLLRVHEDTDLRDAEQYGEPILGNEMAFGEAHRRVTSADAGEISRAREALRQAMTSAIDQGSKDKG